MSNRTVAALAARVEALEARLLVLESSRGLRTQQNAELRRTLASRSEGRLFTSGELVEHAKLDTELAQALQGAFLETAGEIGSWLRDHRGDRDGVVIRRVRRKWQAVYTSVTSCASE